MSWRTLCIHYILTHKVNLCIHSLFFIDTVTKNIHRYVKFNPKIIIKKNYVNYMKEEKFYLLRTQKYNKRACACTTQIHLEDDPTSQFFILFQIKTEHY